MASTVDKSNEKNTSAEMDSLRADVSALRADLKSFITDAGKIAGSFTEQGVENYKAATEKIAHAGKDATKLAGKTVKDYPFAALGVAFGLGAIIGFAKRK